MNEIETMIYAENGFPIEDRLCEVKTALTILLDVKKKRFEDEYELEKKNGNKKAKLKEISPYTIKCEFYKVMSKFKTIDNSVANNATADQIMMIFSDFLELVSWLNEYGTFIPSKQIFSAFSGISPTAYTYLMTDGDSEQKEAILAVENFLVDMNMEAASQGMAKERTTEFRLRTKGNAGHGLRVSNVADDIVEKLGEVKSQAEYNHMLGSIVQQELLGNGKG